jgi:serine protease AprX
MPSDVQPASVNVFWNAPEKGEIAEKILSAGVPQQLECYKGYLRGLATPEQIEELKRAGLDVEATAVRTRAPAVLPRSAVAAAVLGSRIGPASSVDTSLPPRRSKRFDPALKARFERLAQAAPPPVPERYDWYRIGVDKLRSAELRKKLDQLGIQNSGFRDGFLQACISAKEVADVRKLPFVTDIRRYDLLDSVSTDLVIALEDHDRSAVARPEQQSGQFDAVAHLPSDVAAIQVALRNMPGVKIIDASSTTVRFSAPLEDALLARVASLKEVKFLAPYEPPKLLCDRSRGLLGLDALAALASTARATPYTGRGETVGILDSGIDDAHPDFGGAAGTPGSRIGELVSYRNCLSFDMVGHGTHVAGIIAGTGAASGGKVRGMAPEASLIVVGMVNDSGALELPVDLGDLLKEATARGAKIINCSWARRFGTAYDTGSASVDQFVYRNSEILLVLAAGNQGTAIHGDPAFWCVGAPATAKNVLTVGACGSDRPGFAKTWADYDPTRFGGETGKRKLAPDTNNSAAMSSTGPTDYDGVKPDLLAPGTYILAPRASQLLGSLGWEECKDFGGKYVFMHGTSMAAPAVAGTAAVLRQYLREKLNHASPSAALLRAILINATHPLEELQRADAPKVGYPDFDHGFGLLDIATILPVASASQNRTLVFDDVPNDGADALESNLAPDAARVSFRHYKITIPPGATEPLRITLAWTDPPGNGVQNDLQLAVRAPGNAWHYGNERHRFANGMVLPPAAPAQPELNVVDRHNTAEHVRIEHPDVGDYTIRVWARNTIIPPQGYALAVSGEVGAALLRTQ